MLGQSPERDIISVWLITKAFFEEVISEKGAKPWRF